MKNSILAALCASLVFAGSAFAVTAADLPGAWPKGTVTYKCGYAPGCARETARPYRERLLTSADMLQVVLRIL